MAVRAAFRNKTPHHHSLIKLAYLSRSLVPCLHALSSSSPLSLQCLFLKKSVLFFDMWNSPNIATCIIGIFGFLLKISQCAPTSANSTATPVSNRPRFGCYTHQRGAIDEAALVIDCARALLQFPKNADLGR